VVVAVLASFMGGTMIFSGGEGLAILGDILRLVLYMPIPLLLFGAIAFARKDWALATYPLAVFFIVGPAFFHAPVSGAVASQLPFLLHDSLDSNRAFAALILAYAFLYTLEWSGSRLLRRGRFAHLPPSKLTDATSFTLIGVAVVVALATPFVAKALNNKTEYERAAFRAPQTKDFSAYLVDEKEQRLNIRYAEATRQYAGSYKMTDEVTVMLIKQGQSRSTRDVCGTSLTLYGQKTTLQYQKTSSGFEYGVGMVPGSTTSLSNRKTRQFTESRVCFAVDNKKYLLYRTDQYGDDYLKKYPTASVVEAFNRANRVKSTPGLPAMAAVVVDEGVQGINPNAYEGTGYLDVPEFGIRIPLTAEMKDMYYGVSAVNPNWLLGGLRSITTAGCNVMQKRNDNSDRLFTIIRESEAVLQARKEKNPNTGFAAPNKSIGGYKYAMTMDRVVEQKCFRSADQASIFADMLDWATVNIKPL
jgi:hypothetical protein